MNVACIIPARGGSKGIPNKNIYDFAGKPLIYWSIKQALASSMINCDVYVSSDSDEILDLSEQFGAHPIQRPDDLSTDFATSESALIHAQNEISKASEIDDITAGGAPIAPTSPTPFTPNILFKQGVVYE